MIPLTVLLIPYVILFDYLLPIIYDITNMAHYVQRVWILYLLYLAIIYFVFTPKKLPTKLLSFAVGGLFLLLLTTDVSLSKDIYRYIWDGMITVNGYNPLIYKPYSPEFANFHQLPLYKVLDWKDLYSPYPPFAQFVFILSYISYSLFNVIGAKFIFAFPYLLSGILLYKYVDKRFAWIFLLSPLTLIEIVNSGHIDGYITLLLFIVLVLYKKEKIVLSAFFLSLAILTKVYPILFVPVFALDLMRKKEWKTLIHSGIITILTLIVFYIPFLWGTLFPITRYALLYEEQEFNASIFRYLYYYIGENTLADRLWAKQTSLIGFVLFTFLLYIPRLSYKVFLLIGIVYLAFSPLVFPWYLLFLFPFILFEAKETENNLIIYLFTLVQLAMLSMYYEPGIRPVRELMLNIEYIVILGIILFYTVYSSKQSKLFRRLV